MVGALDTSLALDSFTTVDVDAIAFAVSLELSTICPSVSDSVSAIT